MHTSLKFSSSIFISSRYWDKLFIILLFFSFLLVPVLGKTQTLPLKGLPLIKNISRNQYQAGRQNWTITQDSAGLIYIGNNEGILQYDGSFWEKIDISNNSNVRALHKHTDGRIYFGAFNTFGYIDTNEQGVSYTKQLEHLLPQNHQSFGEVWQIHSLGNTVFFSSSSAIFSYNGKQLKTVEKDLQIRSSFKSKGKLHVVGQQTIFTLVNNQLKRQQALPAINKESISVRTAIELTPDSTILCSDKNGLFLLTSSAIEPWQSSANDYLQQEMIYSGAKIDKHHFAVGTVQSGIYIFGSSGDLVYHLSKKNGLQNNTILNIFSDKQSNIWLALDNGLAFIEMQAPFNHLDQGCGVHGAGYSAVSFRDTLYLGTNQGLFYRPTKGSQQKFKPVANTQGQVWNLQVIDSVLLCAHHRGALSVSGAEASTIAKHEGVWLFRKHPNNPNILIAGSYNGLLLFEKYRGNWRYKKHLANFYDSSREMLFDNDANLWIGHGYVGIYRIKLNDDCTEILQHQLYNQNHGLPSNFHNRLFEYTNNQLIVSTLNRLYHYNEATNTFEPNTNLQKHYLNTFPYNKFTAPNGNIYFSSNGTFEKLILQPDGSYNYTNQELMIWQNRLLKGFENIYFYGSNQMLFGIENGFVLVNHQKSTSQVKQTKALIRKVYATFQTDSLLYGGSSHTEQHSVLQPHFRNLIFQYASPHYSSETRPSFRYRLEGFDKKWSTWTRDAKKEYSHLPPGNYRFLVQARNENSALSTIGTYSLQVLPFWYQSTPMFVVYAVFLALLIFLFYRLFIWRINQKRKQIEKQKQKEIAQREGEFHRKQLQKEKQLVELRNANLQGELEKGNLDKELKDKELASFALQITHKNEILNETKDKIEKIKKRVNPNTQGELNTLIQNISGELKLDDDWKQFKLHFEKVHTGFFSRLKHNYPQLTPGDLKLCAYLRMNLSTKEIAPLLGISVRGTEIRRYRLRNKLALHKETNLFEFMMKV